MSLSELLVLSSGGRELFLVHVSVLEQKKIATKIRQKTAFHQQLIIQIKGLSLDHQMVIIHSAVKPIFRIDQTVKMHYGLKTLRKVKKMSNGK